MNLPVRKKLPHTIPQWVAEDSWFFITIKCVPPGKNQLCHVDTGDVVLAAMKHNPLDEILLWSHYAKMHEGVRVGFEFPKDIKFPFKISKVDYREKRFVIDVSQGLSDQTLGDAIVASAKMKSLAWKYEDEYRLMTHPDFCEHRKMPDSKQECFLAFEREWVKSIDFGVRCPKTEIESMLDLLKTDYPKIVRRKAVFHKTEYALEYEVI